MERYSQVWGETGWIGGLNKNDQTERWSKGQY